MSEKDSISIHLVREALLQSCAPGAATVEALSKVGIDPALLEQPDARVPATAYARLWRLLARRHDDEFFGMDPRRLKSGSLAFLCRASMAQPTLATALETALGFLSLMLEQMPAQLVRQQSLALAPALSAILLAVRRRRSITSSRWAWLKVRTVRSGWSTRHCWPTR